MSLVNDREEYIQSLLKELEKLRQENQKLRQQIQQLIWAATAQD